MTDPQDSKLALVRKLMALAFDPGAAAGESHSAALQALHLIEDQDLLRPQGQALDEVLSAGPPAGVRRAGLGERTRERRPSPWQTTRRTFS